ncbi:DotA/TraY family protein [Hahella ganghwensis]|uniref:DotA/TraY family protein n=1 Tax=Hahella ganghwensis TaxID=286420 RepID=UPI00035C630F|nr:DotA/TraY family protein [Hahella ganghwensis]
MKTLKIILILLPLLLSSSGAFASITDADPADKSLEYLRYIFGSTVDVITGGTGPANPDSVLGAMSQILNTGMLVFTGLIIGYVFLTGVLNSAHEGNPLGRMYSTMWVPLRMVVALALVLPFSGGYSTMQIGVMWLAGHGIGLANSTWNAALDHITGTGTLYPPQITVDYENTAMRILESRVCMHGINTADRHINVEEKPVEIVDDDQVVSVRSSGTTEAPLVPVQHRVMQRYDSVYGLAGAGIAYGAAWLSGFPNGIPRSYGSNPCGSITLEFAEIDEGTAIDTPVRSFQNKVIAAHAQLDEDLDSLAREIVLSTVDETAPAPDQTAYNLAVNNFKTEYQKAISDALSEIASARVSKWAGGNPDAAGMTVGARDAGWISVGAWYWDLQRVNAETQKMVSVKAELVGPTEAALEHDDYQTFMDGLAAYSQNMLVTDPATGTPVNAMERSTYADDNATLGFVMGRVESVINFALSEPDPVAGLANVGHVIIGTFETALTAAFVSDLAACVADDTSEAVGGLIGGAARPVTSTLCRMTNKALWSLVGAGLLLIPIALMLAFYLPATPMILWIMGVAGWFVMLIEAVIAAPIWAVSHAMPEGSGFIGERAKAGYMVALSVFLRPALAIFGFFASMLLVIVMLKVVMLIFLPAMSGMIGDSISGVVTAVAMLGIFTVLIIQIAHRAFGLIHEVPDKVLRYIGGGSENLGEASQEQQSRSVFVGGAAKVVGGAGHTMRDKTRGGAQSMADAAGSGLKNAAGAAKTGMSRISKMLSPK